MRDEGWELGRWSYPANPLGKDGMGRGDGKGKTGRKEMKEQK